MSDDRPVTDAADVQSTREAGIETQTPPTGQQDILIARDPMKVMTDNPNPCRFFAVYAPAPRPRPDDANRYSVDDALYEQREAGDPAMVYVTLDNGGVLEINRVFGSVRVFSAWNHNTGTPVGEQRAILNVRGDSIRISGKHSRMVLNDSEPLNEYGD